MKLWQKHEFFKIKKKNYQKFWRHFNICVSIAKRILVQNPKHTIYFIVNEPFEKKVKKISPLFQTIRIKQEDEEIFNSILKNPESFKENFYYHGERRYIANINILDSFQKFYQKVEKGFNEIIHNLQPDFILVDSIINLPFTEDKNIPWGMITSANPLLCQDLNNLPPSMSGLSTINDQELIEKYKDLRTDLSLFKNRKIWYEKNNLATSDNFSIVNGSNYINLFTYPKYTSYFNPNNIVGKWFAVNHGILDEKTEKKFQSLSKDFKQEIIKYPGVDLLTPEFLSNSGKLILISLGTMVTLFPDVINNLLEHVKDIPHKFIVSGGISFDKLKLPENCIGAPYLDQQQLYPKVDLVITHGGNNTFCELFYYGVKMILIPHFGDQPDNGKRVEDLKIGVQLDLIDLSLEKLSNAINYVLYNEDIKEKMKIASMMSKDNENFDKFINELDMYLLKKK
uniref:UDP-glycosyltransferase n=1 Tax=Polyphagotarsonemus latus TaxID=1204166 RepID=A0AAN0LHB4_9ACAR